MKIDYSKGAWIFVKDDDSHGYVIPPHLEAQFEEWNESGAAYWGPSNVPYEEREPIKHEELNFDDYMIGTSLNNFLRTHPECRMGYGEVVV
jgi:hypothetical protein